MGENKDGTSPSRTYVVLLEEEFEDGGTYHVELTRVTARNQAGALRKGFRALRPEQVVEDGEERAATLVAVPESMWRPERVRGRRTERISVSIGG